jgi:hypothetical protein
LEECRLRILRNWPNRKCFIKKANKTDCTVTTIIVKKYRKGKKEYEYVITLETILVL